jgi:hypothetical protein
MSRPNRRRSSLLAPRPGRVGGSTGGVTRAESTRTGYSSSCSEAAMLYVSGCPGKLSVFTAARAGPRSLVSDAALSAFCCISRAWRTACTAVKNVASSRRCCCSSSLSDTMTSERRRTGDARRDPLGERGGSPLVVVVCVDSLSAWPRGTAVAMWPSGGS